MKVNPNVQNDPNFVNPHPKFPREYYEGGLIIPMDLSKEMGSIIIKVAEFYFAKKDLSQRDWKTLIRKGFAEEYTEDEDTIIYMLQSKRPQRLDGATKTCYWCSSVTVILHNHHYPIRKSKGGKETIAICSNCHSEFHHMLDIKKYRLKKEYHIQFEDALKEYDRIMTTFEEVAS